MDEDIISEVSPQSNLQLNTSSDTNTLWKRRLSLSSTSASKSRDSSRKEAKRTKKYGTICQARKNPCLVQPKTERVECLDKLVPVNEVTPKSPVFNKHKPLLSSSIYNRSPVLKVRPKTGAAPASSPVIPKKPVTPKARRSLNLHLIKDEPTSSYLPFTNDIETISSQVYDECGVLPIPISDSSSQSTSTGAEDTEDEITVATQVPYSRTNLEHLNSSMSNMLHIKTPPKSDQTKKNPDHLLSVRKKQQFIRLTKLMEVRQTESRMWRHECQEISSTEAVTLGICSVSRQYHLASYTCRLVQQNGIWGSIAYELYLQKKHWAASKLQLHDIVRIFPPWRSVQVNSVPVFLCPDSVSILRVNDTTKAQSNELDDGDMFKEPKVLFSWNCQCILTNTDPGKCPGLLNAPRSVPHSAN